MTPEDCALLDVYTFAGFILYVIVAIVVFSVTAAKTLGESPKLWSSLLVTAALIALGAGALENIRDDMQECQGRRLDKRCKERQQ